MKTTTETKSTTTAYTKVCEEEKTSRLCARLVLVRAYQSNPATKITTYAVLDDQSPDVFISEALLEQLEVDARSSAQTRLEPRK